MTSSASKQTNKNSPNPMHAYSAGVEDVMAPVKGVMLAPNRSSHILC